MQRIFLTPEQFHDGTARITGSDHQHLARVMRARVGETVVLLDGRGNAYRAEIQAIEKAETTARIIEPFVMPPEPPVFLTVAQAMGKGDKFEQVVQHGTEAGASAFVPVRAARSVAEIADAKLAERLARWRQIAKGAAEQSSRARIADVRAPLRWNELLLSTPDEPLLILHPAPDAAPLHGVMTSFPALPPRLTLAVGPEGGWTETEIEIAREHGGRVVQLGARIFRTETAALVAVAQILFVCER